MRRRTGFTLVELLVSMALIVFIMAILAEAFVEALKTFRSMKSTGDLNARLQAVSHMLKKDLSADHFEGKRRTSDPNFWVQGPPQQGYFRLWHGTHLTLTGIQSTTFVREERTIGSGVDGVPSYRATDHSIQFTVKSRGNNRADFFNATVPSDSPLWFLGTPTSRYQETNTSYCSQWAEVAWFLRANGATTVPAGTPSSSLPLYTLCRRERAVVPSTLTTIADSTGNLQLADLNYQWPGTPATKQDYLEISTSYRKPETDQQRTDTTLCFNSPRDLTIPERRFGMKEDPLTHVVAQYGQLNQFTGSYEYPTFGAPGRSYDEDSPQRVGSDVILTDVVSFCVMPQFRYAAAPTVFTNGSDFDEDKYVDINGINGIFGRYARVFDTWSSLKDDKYDYLEWKTTVPYGIWTTNPGDVTPIYGQITLTGLQISIRVWDAKTNQTRQITIVQDM